jgi:hypothetical protein
MPSAAEQRLGELHSLLERSLEAPDWPRIARVDQAIADCLQQFPLNELDAGAQAVRVRLKTLHDRARVQCAEDCERLRLVLLRHLEYAEARSAYGHVDLYQEGN